MNIELNSEEGDWTVFNCECVKEREAEKGLQLVGMMGEPRKMVVWGLGRGECDSLFLWSVTERPSELDRKENLFKRLPNEMHSTTGSMS